MKINKKIKTCKMKKIIFTIGIPASGKSTWSRKKEEHPNIKRISKDEMRERLCNYKIDEKVLVEIKRYLKKVDTVIVDACNYQNHINFIKEALKNENIQYEEKVFEVDPKECIKRNHTRENKVPPVVIWTSQRRYEKENKLLKYKKK